MRGAFSKDEALRWGFCVQKAFLEFGYNPEIDSTMNEILSSKDIPPIVAKADERPDGDSDIPPVLINNIFKTTFNQEHLKKLWYWIEEYLIDDIQYPYQYLSLLLFLEQHHSKFLGKSRISNKDMQDQMTSWYSTSKVRCSADSLGTYRNGFFESDKFNYVAWVNSDGQPIDVQLKKDQSISGFQTLVKLCNNLEINLSELKI
jgi:hypothetical protein